MKQFFVCTTEALYVTANNADVADAALSVGQMTVIDRDPKSANLDKVYTSMGTTNTGFTSLPAKFQVHFRTNEGIRVSPTITKANVLRGYQRAAVSAVAKVLAIGKQTSGDTTYSTNLPAFNANDIAGIVVSDLTKASGALNRDRYYSYTVVAGDTYIQIIANLITTINNDSKRCVNAAIGYSGSTDSLKLTAITAGNNFDVSPIGILRKANIICDGTGTTVLNVLPQGTYTQMVAMELAARIEDGREMNEPPKQTTPAPNLTNNMWGVVSLLVSGTAYNLSILEYQNPIERVFSGDANNNTLAPEQLIIAVPTTFVNAADNYITRALTELVSKF
jgi:hypothetical protein